MALTEPRRGAREPKVETIGVRERGHCKARPGRNRGKRKASKEILQGRGKGGKSGLVNRAQRPGSGHVPKMSVHPLREEWRNRQGVGWKRLRENRSIVLGSRRG